MVAPANEKPQEVPQTPTAPEPAPAPDDATKSEIKDVTYDGYTFQVNTDLIDDVDAIELIDKIENQQNLKAIIDFLDYLIGKDEYEKLKAYFVEKDGRFKLTKLGELYQAILEQFDPKD